MIRSGAWLAVFVGTALSLFATLAGTSVAQFEEAESGLPEAPEILPLREQVPLIDGIIAERLDLVIPQIMRENNVSMWLLMAREYFEEPVIESMLDARSMAARRRTILIFFDPGEGQPIERLTVSRYGLAGLFEPSWDPAEQPDQWRAVADIIAARDPASIAINYSDLSAFGDGMTLSQYRLMMAALPERFHDRITSGETLAVRWLETRTPREMALYPDIVRTAHWIMSRAFSTAVIEPGVTTADDVVWWYREELSRLGIRPWFHPSVGIQRAGQDGMLYGDTVIQPGDLLWTDFGITYLRLNTDTQHLAYVLREGETAAPQGLVDGLAASNRVQDILREHMQVGLTGNEILARARAQAIAEGINPSIYSHPIGLHGHGAGTAIGFWDNQNGDPRSEYPLYTDTAWSIELTTFGEVPEWDGQIVDFRTEEDAFFDGESVRFLDGRQTELILIGSDAGPAQ
ncbi:M24 family metallopeptidase [Maricaulis sp.]|uniref:M24 family metallopeptidase n=1 Tax=Maricaulis sp. TaxID=1486257 RepID=UPI001B041691|nr:M24 family metallopeptidase [Maricaulis sp.]MBO6798074.1 aminopeptidase P family protein [Maricaulis sp.]